MTEVTLNWRLNGQPAATTVVLDVPGNAGANAPLVVLLHGTSGTIDDMSNPGAHPGMNYEKPVPGTIVDRDWHDYPNVGFWSLGTDPAAEVVGWAPSLAAAGFPTLNYGQRNNRDRLVEPLQELRAIFNAIEHDGRFLPVRNRRIVLIGHSRGGLLARMLIVDLARTNEAIRKRVKTCITVHAPNQGSTLANTAAGLTAILSSWQATGVPGAPTGGNDIALEALEGVQDWILSETSAPAYQDFSVGSPTLLTLTSNEPVPGVSYYTFGGTRPVLVNLRGWAFTPESAFPVPHFPLPRFHWFTAYVPLLPLPPPGLLPFPELLPGGDVLTQSAMTRLPFALHRDNYLNHAECLWDDSIKSQVLAILQSAPLPESLVIIRANVDSNDPDRAIDALGGIGSTGAPWQLSLEEALGFADSGTPLFVLGENGGLVPVQRVHQGSGRRYLRALPSPEIAWGGWCR